jgi:hypothetical protein
VQSAVGSALLALGDGNWKMGEGVQVGMASKLGDGDEQVIIEHFICTFLYRVPIVSPRFLYRNQTT